MHAASPLDRCSPWPARDRLPRLHALCRRLASLPAEVQGISLAVLRDTSLPDATPSAKVGDEQALTGLPADAGSERVAAALLPARRLHAQGQTDAAATDLLQTARTLRQEPPWSLAAVWLLEVAVYWLGEADASPVGSQVRGELGDLLAQTGDARQGTELLEQAAEDLTLDHAVSGSPASARLARWFSYLAAKWQLRLLRAAEAPARLERLRDVPGPPDAAWFHATLELVVAERATLDANALIRTRHHVEGLLDQVTRSGLSAPEKARLRAHAAHALGKVLIDGPNRYVQGQGRDHYERAVTLYRQARDPSSEAQALDGLARVLSRLGEHERADRVFAESVQLKQELKDLWGLGATFNGLADSLVRRGRPVDALPLYEANIRLMQSFGSQLSHLIKQNRGQQLMALLANARNPFDAAPPEPRLMEQAEHIFRQYVPLCPADGRDPYLLMIRGAWQRLHALAAADRAERLRLLASGIDQLRQSLTLFEGRGRGGAEIHLAGMLVDRARLLDGEAGRALLDEARTVLESAEGHVWDTYERPFLELVWAWYFQTLGQAVSAQHHLAAARRHAEACGNRGIAVDVDARLGVHLTGPTGQDACDVLLPPGERLRLEFRVADWRGRPLARYRLRASVEAESNRDGGLRLTPEAAETDPFGRAVFEVTAGPTAGRAVLQVGDAELVRVARVRLCVQPFAIEHDPLREGPGERIRPLDADDEVVLRNLFGPDFRRLLLRREFGEGQSGARLLLFEPFLHAPNGAELRGQPCIVKLGPRRTLEDEARRYERWVKDLLPANVSQFAGRTAWGERAGLRMSLAGGQDWGRAKAESEWLPEAAAFEAHLLLERVFVGDLGACWYSNAPSRTPPQPLVRVCSPIVPSLLTLCDDDPPRGLLPRPPDAALRRLEDGLLPPESRPFAGGEEIALGGLEVMGVHRVGVELAARWEYELRCVATGLRATFLTPLSPELIDRDGIAERLLEPGTTWHVLGRVEQVRHDQLHDALRACLEQHERDRPDERIALSADGAWLELGKGPDRRLPNPLRHLHALLLRPLPCQLSLIHGDLHPGNVIVGERGQPYYIDFGKTAFGPTLFDFIKHEVYLWHQVFARWPQGPPPPECSLTNTVRLLEHLNASELRQRFPSPFAPPPFVEDRRSWLARFAMCVGTVRAAARPYIVADNDQDYFAPLCLYAGLMLRWCDPRSAREPSVVARQGLIHTLLAGSLLASGLVELGESGV